MKLFISTLLLAGLIQLNLYAATHYSPDQTETCVVTMDGGDDDGCNGGSCPLPGDGGDKHEGDDDGCNGGSCPLPGDGGDKHEGDDDGCNGGSCPLPGDGE